MVDEKTENQKQKGIQSRKTALEVLLRVTESGAYSNIALSKALDKSPMSKRDKAFVTLLVQGVTRNLTFLDDIISRYSKRPLDSLPPVLMNTLRMAMFQLEMVDDMPPSAVLNTSADIARLCGHKGMASYTTAVLRNYLRAKDAGAGSGSQSSGSTEPAGEITTAQMATKFSIPQWLIERWLTQYGPEETQALLIYSSSEPRIVVRANEQGITPEGLATVFENAGIKFTISPLMPSCLVLESKKGGRGDPSKLPGYEEGLFSIQDDTAAIVAKIVDPKPGETIIDLCAAPGGKALYMGELMENKGRVVAIDKQANRLELMKKNRNRLGISNVEAVIADGRTYDQKQLVDRILVDAPCSGTGVLNRKTDLRHRLKQEDIRDLAILQSELIENSQRMLKPGGVFVYATCSVEPDENVRVIEHFLSQHSDFKLDDLTPFFPKDLVERHGLSDSLKTGMIQILPSIDNLSGFFIARMIKSP